MPVIYKIERKDGQRTAVWEIMEDESTLLKIAALNKTDLRAFSLITNEGRRLEWLAVRVLLKEFYPANPSIDYHENGKPLLVNPVRTGTDGHTDKISISHSGNMVAIALHSDQSPGIDIEMLHPRIFKIASRFISEMEKRYLGANPSIEQLTVTWGAKEVMFKVYAHGGVTFKSDLNVKPFTLSSKGILEGLIHKDANTILIPMEYMKIGNFILVQTNYAIADLGKNADL
jgi:4'-phosphopantetheinyl transferase